MPLSLRSFPLLPLVVLVGCSSPRGARGGRHPFVVPPGDTLVAAAGSDRADEFERGAIHIGNRGPGPGGGFTVSVGSQFGVPEAEEVYRRLVALEADSAFKEFTCPGDSLPHIRFRFSLTEEGEYQDRQVSVGHTPHFEPWGDDRCLDLGLHYLVQRTFAEVDSGPSLDYGYYNPSTGAKYGPEDPGERHARWRPVCRCQLREQDDEWAKAGPKETTLGAAARSPE
ncbi:MAG: hypothetical protein HOQ11_13765 [Gemmatimonadaceae bacterium]|nr:hypothetical protein [Gemmatimonadaceae bacterium]NUQ92134.1 hypothetical protein [Gemmatimonadaceae bacterium]NUR21199.1 hypothetical protein [Gemmatimonadaceae bacterium]NUS98468.1 hypothetical protein [Gemmatimonadaceae bacterium]